MRNWFLQYSPRYLFKRIMYVGSIALRHPVYLGSGSLIRTRLRRDSRLVNGERTAFVCPYLKTDVGRRLSLAAGSFLKTWKLTRWRALWTPLHCQLSDLMNWKTPKLFYFKLSSDTGTGTHLNALQNKIGSRGAPQKLYTFSCFSLV